LAGGGTDVASYCDVFGGSVLNVTIDRYAYTYLKIHEGGACCIFNAPDMGIVESVNISDIDDFTPSLKLHFAVYLRVMRDFNAGKYLPIEVSTYCDAPVGSGLGSSSTLVVSMIKAYVELLNLALDDYDIAELAFKVERSDCGFDGGRQDQYSATFGGVNFIEFYDGGRTIVNPLRLKNWVLCELESSLLLYYTGVSRESAKIIADQRNNITQGISDAIESMHEVKAEAVVMKNSLLKGDFEEFVSSMHRGWCAKKKSAKTVSNAEIDRVYATAVKAGALAGKVSGAGGGGFMLLFVPNQKRMDVINALSRFDGQISNCHFTHHGCQAWRP
jgi:D-glycero-alpha-D-manno-heptose-7-phosphate kinase